MSRSISIVAVLLLSAGVAYGEFCPAGEWCQWTTDEGGNGHWYRLTSFPLTWEDAEAEAVATDGHLVTINSAAENQWLLDTFGYFGGSEGEEVRLWIGFTDKFAEGHFQWIGEVQDPGEAWDGGWWECNGDGTSYTNWRLVCNVPSQNYACMNTLHEYPYPPGTWLDSWNDEHVTAGIIERADAKVPTVSEWGLIAMAVVSVGLGAFMFTRRRREPVPA